MKRFSYWIRNYFGFSQQEVSGFVILILLILVFLFLPLTYNFFTRSDLDYSSDHKQLDSLIAKMNEMSSPSSTNAKTETKNHLQKLSKFDPNKITKEELMALGIEKKIAERILKFRIHGGHFKIKKDLMKIYGFPEGLYSKLENYILLPDTLEIKKNKTISQAEKFDINKADTMELNSLKGIGKTLAGRIIKYRDLLGGYYSKDQFKEIFGLTPLALDELNKYTFICNDFSPMKININSSNIEVLNRHPYIKNKLGNTIINFRIQHGSFKSKEDLIRIKSINMEELNKLLPYLNFD